jgi:hypothetical protein
MFNFLREFCKQVKPKKIIHLGHMLDDDNDISWDWGKMNNLVVVAKDEELKRLQEQRNKFDFKYEIVRGNVNIGDLAAINQSMIGDYVNTRINGLDSQIFDSKIIVNSNRHEWATKCSDEGVSSYILSPGCLCERHLVQTIKQIDFKDGGNRANTLKLIKL